MSFIFTINIGKSPDIPYFHSSDTGHCLSYEAFIETFGVNSKYESIF